MYGASVWWTAQIASVGIVTMSDLEQFVNDFEAVERAAYVGEVMQVHLDKMENGMWFKGQLAEQTDASVVSRSHSKPIYYVVP